MICDRVENMRRYAGCVDYVKRIETFLHDNPVHTLSDGPYSLQGELLFATVSSIETQVCSERKWESHDLYADMQVVLTGIECYGFSPAVPGLKSIEAYPQRDLLFYEDSGVTHPAWLHLEAGQFIYFAPGELHKPCCRAEEHSTVRKIVFKILQGNHVEGS